MILLVAKKIGIYQASGELLANLTKKWSPETTLKNGINLKMKRMKPIIFLVPILGLMISCSGENKQTEKTSEELQEQIELIESSTQKLDESINSTDYEMVKTQSEIDSLLNNI
jgi:hypothetical protein